MSKKLQATRFAGAAAALAALAFVSGCATPPPPAAPDAEVMAKLASYSERASLSMQRLAALRSATSGLKIEPGQVPAGLDAPVSITWSGPIEEVVRKVAILSGYKFGGILSNTKTPVLVSISVENMTAFNVLADLGAQAGSAADIVIHPDIKTIFVKYPPTARAGGYPEKSN